MRLKILALIVILIGSIATYSQDKDTLLDNFKANILDYKAINMTENNHIYWINVKRAKYEDNLTKFVGLGYADKDNYIFTYFSSDCLDYSYSVLSYVGKLKGERVSVNYGMLNKLLKAEPNTVIYLALDELCKLKFVQEY